MGTVGIKTARSEFKAVIAKTIRKYRDISISEIKKLVLEEDYLYECNYIDASGIKVVLAIHLELNKSGIATDLYEHDRLTNTEFLNNWLASHEETVKQVEEEMNREALLEEGEYD